MPKRKRKQSSRPQSLALNILVHISARFAQFSHHMAPSISYQWQDEQEEARTPLIAAASGGGHAELVKFLITQSRAMEAQLFMFQLAKETSP